MAALFYNDGSCNTIDGLDKMSFLSGEKKDAVLCRLEAVFLQKDLLIN